MITVHIIIRSGALEGESSRSFGPGKSGRYRGVESYLKKVKKMYNSAVKDYKKVIADRGRYLVMKNIKMDTQQESGFMSITIVPWETTLFPYGPEEISKLKTKYKVS